MKKAAAILVASALLIISLISTCFALNASTKYFITTSKFNSDGTLTAIETVPATTDAAGKLSFTLTTLPTNAEVNFIAFAIKDLSGSVVLQGVAPAPPAGDQNEIGINDLATAQAATFIKAAALAGTDDPILAAYLLVILRSSSLSPDDVVKLATLGKEAIRSNIGFEAYLLANIPQAKFIALQKCLVYNPDPSKTTLRDFTKGFFTAVESGDATTESSETQKAGGLMADVFMDAAACADVELDYITNAHNAAGNGAEASGLMSGPGAITPNVMSSIDQSMSAFGHKVGMVKMVTEYSNALSALKATGAQVDTFINAAKAMAASNNSVDVQYGDFFKDPAAYLAAHPGSDAQSVQSAINAIYQNSWTTFQSAIAASDAQIAALKAGVLAAFPGLVLPPDFGKNNDGSQNPPNWPVQQVVMVSWMVDLIKAGGSIGYTRDTTPIPAMMQQWQGVCSKAQYWDQQSCQSNGGTWTVSRSSFDTPSSAFNAYLGIQQDVSIADMARNSIWNGPNGTQLQPTQDQRMQAAADFVTLLGKIQGNIVATKAGGVAASDAEKQAIIKLMLQPQDN